MFNLQGKKDYKLLFINGGVSSKGNPYSFITAEAEPYGNQKYGDKIKINVWGADLSNQFKPNDYIKILGANEVGNERRQDKNTGKWYENLTITCNAEDIVLGEKVEKQGEVPAKFQEIPESELPF